MNFRPSRGVAALLLSIAMIMSLFGGSRADAAITTFADVPPGTQFSTEIGWLAAQGISTGWLESDGTRTYRPLQPVNRDAMAAFMYRLAGSPAYVAPAVPRFTDVATDNQFYKEISWLAEEGISTGWPDGTFRPVQPVNRDAMAAFMYRFSESPTFTSPATSPFSDVAPGVQFYKEMTWLASSGISTGWPDGTYRPGLPVNRDAMAAFMYRLANGPGERAANQLAIGYTPPNVADARARLHSLVEAPQGSMDGYARTQFGNLWLDATNWGWQPIPVSTCDVRQATLYRDGVNVSYDSACTISAGWWLDPYTAVTLTAPSDVDIDHVVPLAEAWRSGAAAWTLDQRKAFAHAGLVVLAVDDGANASKGDKTPDLWKPPNVKAHCLYAKRWVVIKQNYQLTVHPSEKSALNTMLDTCAS